MNISSNPAITTCHVSAWVLTAVTGSTAIFTTVSYTENFWLQIAAAALASVITAMLIVFTNEAPQQPFFGQFLLWIAVAVLMSISIWGTARALQETFPLAALRVSGTDSGRWYGFLIAGALIDILRAACVWTIQAIESRQQRESEAEERRQHRKKLQRQQEAALFPTPEAPKAVLPEQKQQPEAVLSECFQAGERISKRRIQGRLGIGFAKAKDLYEKAEQQGLIDNEVFVGVKA